MAYIDAGIQHGDKSPVETSGPGCALLHNTPRIEHATFVLNDVEFSGGCEMLIAQGSNGLVNRGKHRSRVRIM